MWGETSQWPTTLPDLALVSVVYITLKILWYDGYRTILWTKVVVEGTVCIVWRCCVALCNPFAMGDCDVLLLLLLAWNVKTNDNPHGMLCVWPKPFFNGLHTLRQGGGVLACLFGNSGCPQQNPPPPPPGGGRPRVGWPFLGKIFVSKIFILPLSSRLPDPVGILAVLRSICGPEVVGSNPGVVIIKPPVSAGCARLRFCEGTDSK